MTPTEKAAFTNQASRMGLSLGQFFREAGAAYVSAASQERADPDALDVALRQLKVRTARTEAALDSTLTGLINEQQRRIDELNTRMVRLETVLEIALNRSALPMQRLAESDPEAGPSQ